jgi:phosphoribosylaminoimidazolecarboxamide formyltransferase/IMP cyclohydrolase
MRRRRDTKPPPSPSSNTRTPGASPRHQRRRSFALALRCDPVSAFGGIIACNRTLDGATAEQLAKIFTEVIIAPDADEDAKKILSAKKNLRLLLAGGLPDPATAGATLRTVAGGFLLQTRDNGRIAPRDLKVVTKRKPTDQEITDLIFAFRVAKHVKSNTIVYAKGGATAGIGAGQMSRIDLPASPPGKRKKQPRRQA